MNSIEIITKKKNKLELTKEEIAFMVNEYVSGNIPDYQMSAFLMAIVCNGMTIEETVHLTDIMIQSGETIDLSEINGKIVDKHSTGGIGDKTTLVLAPLVASCGVRVAKMSGRGLGVTGGTIDKLESIAGFQVEATKEKFIEQVNTIGVAIMSQTGNIAPADKKIYALRDVSGTTESIPLIASSIMSKKIASGADAIVLDVKVGSGALMKTIEDARSLAHTMITIGAHYGKPVKCVLTNMNEPLGYAVGNGIEVIESIETLKGNGPTDLEELVLTLGSLMVSIALDCTKEKAIHMLKENLQNGKGYEKLKELVTYQKGDMNQIEQDPYISIKSPKSGFITKIDANQIGEVVKRLGAGRMQKEDSIDYGVGICLSVKVGDFVLENEELVRVHFDGQDISMQEILDCFTFSQDAPEKEPLILEVIE